LHHSQTKEQGSWITNAVTNEVVTTTIKEETKRRKKP